MKIYYVANARMPTEKAHGIQIAEMCEALIEAGAEVELIVPRRGRADRTIKDFYDLRVEIPTVRIWTPDWYGRGRLGFWASSFFFMSGYARHIRSKNEKGEKGFIWAIDIDQFSFFLIPFLGMPYIAEIHDAKPSAFSFRALFKRAMRVIVINDIIGGELRHTFGIPADSVLIHPNGVDLSRFQTALAREAARERLSLRQGVRIVMYTGKIYPWKGLDIFIDAARAFEDGAYFYFVGDTEVHMREVTDKSSPPSMVYAGHQDYRKIPLWLAAADVLVLGGTKENAYSYSHTSPMKLFEYMASGRPIVAADTPANREIVSEREVFFYKPDDAAALKKAIDAVFADPTEAALRAERAKEKVAIFSWEKRACSIVRSVGNI